jgi:acetolactate synthase-1/2/3 large subunit
LAIAALDRELVALGAPAARWQPRGRDYATEHILQVGGNIHPGKLVQALSARLPDNAIVLADAGAHAAWLGYYLRLTGGQQFRKPGSFGPMAGHVNGAIGLKLAHPDRPVIVGCGDGGYLLSGFELMTAVEHNVPSTRPSRRVNQRSSTPTSRGSPSRTTARRRTASCRGSSRCSNSASILCPMELRNDRTR